MAAPVPDALDPAAPLARFFGHSAFRPGQEDVVRAALAGRDVLAVMPTGSGKSLGYQLPAVILPGTALVVSPLIALMKDQVDELRRKGIAAAALHSLNASDERREILSDASRGALRLLYVAPERFASESFHRFLPELAVSIFAVDEAHCVSEWGHDFRPDYRRLADAAARCRRADGVAGRPPVLAFTATATPEVRDDVVSLLGLRSPAVFVTGFDRPNLVLAVRRVSGELEKREILPELVGGRRALVYASTRKSAERAAEALSAAGIAAAAYHAGLSEAERTEAQEGFSSGARRVVCATNAFGMGIDRPDVEAVVHYEIPGSLEAYYQEIGRGGRDGRRADVTLLWNYVDVKTREFLIEKEDEDDPRRERNPVDPAQREARRELERKKLQRMVAYADSRACLRATLLRYFGETGVPDRCGRCGSCARLAPLSGDDLLLVRKVLSGVARAGERWGKRKVAAMLVGDLEALPESLARLSTTGLLSAMSAKSVEAWLDAAVGSGLLRATDDVYRTLSLTPEGRDVMAGRAMDVLFNAPEPPPEKRAKGRAKSGRTAASAARDLAAADERPVDEALLSRLKAWRRDEASRRRVPPYVVFHDKTLALVAATAPRSLDALSVLPGIGPAKLAEYGAAILAVVSSVSEARGS